MWIGAAATRFIYAHASSPPEKTFVLLLSKARQKMLERCSPFSFTGVERPWMAFSMCHRSTRRSSPPAHATDVHRITFCVGSSLKHLTPPNDWASSN